MAFVFGGVGLGFGGGGLGPKVGGALSALIIFPAVGVGNPKTGGPVSIPCAVSLIKLLYAASMFGMSACGAS